MSVEAGVEDWELLAQVCQAYRNLSDLLMEQIEMHRGQATLLCRLFVQEGMSQSELAEQLSVQGATVTNMLQRMEEAGLVSRCQGREGMSAESRFEKGSFGILMMV
jgi:MarR family transcriptional regulator, organic hydroperoxide resistance regulator